LRKQFCRVERPATGTIRNSSASVRHHPLFPVSTAICSACGLKPGDVDTHLTRKNSGDRSPDHGSRSLQVNLRLKLRISAENFEAEIANTSPPWQKTSEFFRIPCSRSAVDQWKSGNEVSSSQRICNPGRDNLFTRAACDVALQMFSQFFPIFHRVPWFSILLISPSLYLRSLSLIWISSPMRRGGGQHIHYLREIHRRNDHYPGSR
jgi:hypothetical protein